MKCNVGDLDGNMRIAVGTALMVVASLYGSVWGLVGVAMLGTGLLHWCPLYAPLRLSTLK